MSYTGNTVQKSQKNKYIIPCGGVSTKSCNETGGVVDWDVGRQNCGAFIANQPYCVTPDFDDCSLGKNDLTQDPLVKIGWNKQAPNITCTYDPLKMTSLNVIQNYKTKFGETSDYDNMMLNFCSGLGKKCITNPLTGQPFTLCSKLKSGDVEGDACRAWFNKKSSDIQDTCVTNYCFKHENAPDCKCITRVQDPNYKTVKSHSTFNDGCWYPPCVGQNAYLVTSDLKNPTCPSNLCQIVFEELQNKNVNISDVKNSISCDFKLPAPPAIVPSPQPVFPPLLPVKNANATTLFIAVGLIALGTGIAIYFYRKKRL
jgi:hypothetical protein